MLRSFQSHSSTSGKVVGLEVERTMKFVLIYLFCHGTYRFLKDVAKHLTGVPADDELSRLSHGRPRLDFQISLQSRSRHCLGDLEYIAVERLYRGPEASH